MLLEKFSVNNYPYSTQKINVKKKGMKNLFFFSLALYLSLSSVTFGQDILVKTKLDLGLESIHPTQIEFGQPKIFETTAKLKQMSHEKRQKYLDDRPIPFVLGPNNRRYILDRHHLTKILWNMREELQSPPLQLSFLMKADYSEMKLANFWNKMEELQFVYPKEKGIKKDFAQIPSHINELKEDYYRGIVWVMAQLKVIKKSPQPFAEFRWAQRIRQRVKIDPETWHPTNLKKILEDINQHPDAYSDLPGFNKRKIPIETLLKKAPLYLPAY